MNRHATHVARVGKLLAPVDETGVVQKMQVQTSPFEIRDATNSMQLFGLASSPLPGADVVVLNLAADNSNGCIIATNDQRYRPQNMAGGEVMVYDSGGQQVYLSSQGGRLSIKITAGQEVDITAAATVKITAPTVAIVGNLTVTGTIISQGNITAGAIDLETHHHTGVQTGIGSTGGPGG